MKKTKKKGFTLIELMIVLAIIAILAVVLIPKAGSSKNNAKSSGIITNVNTVRGFLETKIADTTNYTNAAGALKINNSIYNEFNSVLINPFTPANKSVSGTVTSGAISAMLSPSTATDTANTNSIVVHDNTTATNNTVTLLTGTPPTSIAGNKGTVYVYVCTDGFVVFGVASNGDVVSLQGVN